jgi:serine/threonine protein kinase
MFLREARVAAALDHPNIVAVTDFGQHEGQDFLAMEYVHGADLNTVLENAACGNTMPLEVALNIVHGACTGLHYAHERRDGDGTLLELVHRDVSPSNVVISHYGAVKVTDFGIATATARTRATSAGTLKGKAGYMSPEQCKGLPIDRRSDVFALGILLYETTVLERLFWGENDYAVMNRIITVDIPRPSGRRCDYPPELEAITLRALAPDPGDRFPTAAALADALESIALRLGLRLSPRVVARWMRQTFGDVPYPTFAESEPPLLAPDGEPSSNRLAWWLAGAMACSVAVGVGFTLHARALEAQAPRPETGSTGVVVVPFTVPLAPAPPVPETVPAPEPRAQKAASRADVAARAAGAHRAPRRSKGRRHRADPVYDLDSVLPPQ